MISLYYLTLSIHVSSMEKHYSARKFKRFSKCVVCVSSEMTCSSSYHRKIGPPQYPARPQAPARLPQVSSQIPLKGWASKDRYNITGEPQVFVHNS